MSKIHDKIKNFKLKTSSMLKKLKEFALNIDIDFLFLLCASFVLTYQYTIWQRILFSFGLVYIYKLVIKDIILIKSIKRS